MNDDDQGDCGRGDRIEVADRVLAAGFTTCPNLILRDGRLSAAARLLYGVLLSYAWQSNQCFPSMALLAANTGVSEESVRRHMRQLMEAGLVSVRRRGLGRSNLYTLHLPRPTLASDEPILRPVKGIDPAAHHSAPARVRPHKNVGSTLRRHVSDPTRMTDPDPTPVWDEEDSGKKTQDLHLPPRDHSTTQAPPDGDAGEATPPENVVPLQATTKTPRKPDLIWEAMVSVWGYAPANDGERGPWNKAGFHFRRAGVTPEEIGTLVDRYRHKYPTAACTPLAVSTKVGELRAYTVPAAKFNGTRASTNGKGRMSTSEILAWAGIDSPVSPATEVAPDDRGSVEARFRHVARDVAAPGGRPADDRDPPRALPPGPARTVR